MINGISITVCVLKTVSLGLLRSTAEGGGKLSPHISGECAPDSDLKWAWEVYWAQLEKGKDI